MTTSASVPVTVMPEAAARIAKLGLQAPIDRMIAYARENLPDLDRIEVILYDRYDLDVEPGLAVEVYSRRPFNLADRVGQNVDHWMAAEFPGEVLEHVILDYHPGAPHAG
jgi:hypothetical protein